jgi:hypothetical protein
MPVPGRIKRSPTGVTSISPKPGQCSTCLPNRSFHAGGRQPVNQLLLRRSVSNIFFHLPQEGGTVPTRRLPFRSSHLSAAMFDQAGGNGPCSLLSAMCRVFSLVRAPQDGGNLPAIHDGQQAEQLYGCLMLHARHVP